MLTMEEMEQALTDYASALSPGSRAAHEVIEARKRFKKARRIIEGAHVSHHPGEAFVCANCGRRIVKVGRAYLHDPVTWGHIVQKIPGANDGRRCHAEGDAVASLKPTARIGKSTIYEDGSLDYIPPDDIEAGQGDALEIDTIATELGASSGD